MKSELWRQVSEVFQSALRLERHERARYLANVCGDDDTLHRQVQSLLDAHEDAEDAGFIGEPAIGLAPRTWIEDESMMGKVIDHYHVLKLIGAGGMGEVYLADDTILKRPVAIKVLLAETALDRDRIRRFTQEARAASALNHPNILTVYQVGDFRNSRFIVTEYIKGKTLRDQLVNGPLALAAALDIAIQVAAALNAAHRSGIIHRDIKPENVMLRDDGFVKVLDFGLAKLAGQNAETEELRTVGRESETRDQLQTIPGTIMGTAAYMSPEQARGIKVDARSDIWSLGVLLYEMVTGRLPFSGATSTDTITTILNTEPDPIEGIPVELEGVLEKALQKNADERYQEIGDLLTDLRELKQDLEFTAKLEKGGSPLVATREKLAAPTKIQPRTTVSIAESIARRIASPKFAAGGGLAFLVLAISVVYYLANRPSTEEKPSAGAIESIAVLPFVNGTGNADIEYLSDGLTDSLINSLSQVPNVTVKSRSLVFQYKGKEVNPQTIGADLSVQAALFGRVSQLNDVLTISLELADTQSGDRIWGELYTRRQADLVSLQSELTRDVASKLGARLAGTRVLVTSKVDTSDPEAYQLFLQGLSFLNKRTAEDIRKSIALFERATERDPSYAKAYAYLASACITLIPYNAGLSREEQKELVAKAQAAVYRARDLDDSLFEVHSVLGTFNYAHWKFAEAEKEYRQAILLNPNDAAVRSAYAMNLSVTGQYEEAVNQANKAYQIDPLSRSIAFNLGARYQEARRFDEAIAQLNRVLELEPDHALTHLILAYTYEAVGKYAEAIREHRAADVSLQKTTPAAADRKAAALTRALRAGGVQRYWQERLKISRMEYEQQKGSAYEIAIVHARLGERDRALEYLEKAFAGHELYLPWVGTQSAFDEMDQDPRFLDLLRRIGVR